MPQGDFVYEGGRSNVTRVAPCQYTAMVNNDRCMIASVINHSGCFLTSAIPITDTYIRWTLIGPDGGSLHTLFKDLREKGYEFEVESIGAINQEPVLTAKQEKCFNKAVEMGYYSVPKKTDLDAIADALGISKSSLNVTLRTAERNIFRFYSEGFVVSEKKKE
jgi:predicted DNA binding protein